MTPSEYERFKGAFEAENSPLFVLQEWRTTPGYLEYAKVRMNGTTFTNTYGTDRINAYGIIEQTLNLKDVRTKTFLRVLCSLGEMKH